MSIGPSKMLKIYIYTLTLLPLAQAWTFLYTNATSNATILHESDTTNCTKIDLAKGKEFSWDPEGADLCISIYYDDTCTSRGGLSCGAWKKDSGNNYHGIEIFKNDESSSSTSVSTTPTPTPTTFSSTAASPTSTTTVFPTDDTNASSSKKDSTSSISGGGIAGIVIGVVAALSIIGLLLFYFLRRKSKSSMTRPPSSIRSSHKLTLSDMQSAMPPHEFAFVNYEKTPPPSRGRPAPGAKLVELPGGNQTVELENSPVSGDGDSSGFRFNRF